MAMGNCDNCLENSWSFKAEATNRGTGDVEERVTVVTATCKLCGHEVEFEKIRKVNDIGTRLSVTCDIAFNDRVYKDGVEMALYRNTKGHLQIKPKLKKFYPGWKLCVLTDFDKPKKMV